MLPDAAGPSLARRLRSESRTREVPIIMLTARASDSDKVAGLEAGADDYVTKPFSPRELEARIQAVLRRRAPQISKEAVEIEGLTLNPATRSVTGDGRTLKMGPTEFELLHFFMTHTDRVYSRAQILDQVWGDHVFLEDRTVDVHIRRLREALGPSGHERLVGVRARQAVISDADTRHEVVHARTHLFEERLPEESAGVPKPLTTGQNKKSLQRGMS